MAEFPSLPLFTDAYLGDTTHLTTTEHGAYLLLLMAQWRAKDCRLPADDKMLARYTKMTPNEWAKVRDILECFFMVAGGYWVQLRLRDEREYVEGKRQKNIEAGRVSALKRKGRHSTDVITTVPTEWQHEGNQPTTHTPNPHPQEEKEHPSDVPKKPKTDRGKRLEAYLEEIGVEAVSQDFGLWAVKEGLTADEINRQMEKFRDYWKAISGQKGVKADWPATWRNWIRKTIADKREKEHRDEIFRNRFSKP